ncbi:MAG TPA: glutamate racemase [Candidatus Paceibacterota bacterium]
MKIGVFDSGLGGLFVTRALVKNLPQYDYMYLGDTQRMPYGNRSHETIYQFLREAVDYLFSHGCELIVVACNTASAEALRRIQQEYLPEHYPRRKVLGIIIPTAEAAVKDPKIKRVGILATQGTVASGAYVRELKKIRGNVAIFQQAAPLLVPLVENNAVQFADPILRSYLRPLLKKNIDVLILGCTHYPILKKRIKNICGRDIKIISQDEIISAKLKDYLRDHPEIEKRLGKNKRREFLVTDLTSATKILSNKWFGKNIKFRIVRL